MWFSFRITSAFLWLFRASELPLEEHQVLSYLCWESAKEGVRSQGISSPIQAELASLPACNALGVG